MMIFHALTVFCLFFLQISESNITETLNHTYVSRFNDMLYCANSNELHVNALLCVQTNKHIRVVCGFGLSAHVALFSGP